MLKDQFKDSKFSNKFALNNIQKIYEDTYSTISELKQNDSIYTAYYIVGNKTNLLKVQFDSKIIPKDIIINNVTNINEKYFTATIDQVSIVLNEIVNYLEGTGNTFVEVSLKNLITLEEGFEAELNIANLKNRYINTIIVKGYSKFPKSFIKHYLNLQNLIVLFM